MTWRHVRRTAAISLTCGFLGALLLVAGARWITPHAIDDPLSEGGWLGRTPAWVEAGGFLDSHVDPDSGRTLRWTGGAVRLFLPALDRSQAYRLIVEAWNIRG